MIFQGNFRAVARKFGPGRAALYLYHRPTGLIRKSIAEGGPVEQWRTERGRRAMVESALVLPPLSLPEADSGASVNFLSGVNYWYQTVFCFASIQIQSPFRITPIIHDDGTLDAQTQAAISRVIPWVRYVASTEIEKRLDCHLPVSRFPRLRARRIEYPHLRKLTDIHIGAEGWTLVLDSDMLAFRRPQALIDWFDNPGAIYMQDIATMYGYPADFLADLAGAPIPERVNVGLYALYGPSIDWDAVEFWCGHQLDDFGTNYLQEQGLTAMLLGRARATPLHDDEYIVLPNLTEGIEPHAVLHHYVAHSKRSYYQFGWKRIFKELVVGNVPTGPLAQVRMVGGQFDGR